MKTLIVLMVALLSPAIVDAASTTSAEQAEASDEGLVPVDVKGLDHVYARPDADLSAYSRVMLDPVEVSFSKSWKPDPAGGPITASERQTIRAGLAKIVRDELRKQLAASGRYKLVDAPETDVLRVRAEIRDLYMNAPAIPRAGRTRTYALSQGEMRLVAELRDAPTGSLIARVVDLKRDPDAPWLHFTSQLDNVAAARRAVAAWAQVLIRQLDAAHAIKK